MKLIFAFALFFSFRANAWTAGTYKCKNTTFTISEITMSGMNVPFMTVQVDDQKISGFARLVENTKDKTEWLVLGEIAMSFKNGVFDTDWCEGRLKF